MTGQLPQDLIPPHLWGDRPSTLVASLCALDPEDRDTRITCAVLLPMAASRSTLRILLDGPAVQQLMEMDAKPFDAGPDGEAAPAAWPSEGCIYCEFPEPLSGDAPGSTIHGVLFSPPDRDGMRTALVPLFDSHGESLSVRGLRLNPDTFEPAPEDGQEVNENDLKALRRYRHLLALATPPETALEPLAMSARGQTTLAQAGADNPWQVIRQE